MNRRVTCIVTAVMVLSLSHVWAQDTTTQPAITTTEMDTMPGMEHGKMKHNAKSDAEQEHSLKTRTMQGGSPPADARDPNAYSEGYDFGIIPRPRLADETNFFYVLLDRLEQVESSENASSLYDLEAWYGRDYNRAVLKAEGTIDNGRLEDGRTELLWGHAVATYWDTQLGVRYDNGDGPNRKWLAFGMEGIAPYWFDVEVTAYIGENGRTAVSLDVAYDLLLTQQFILQPRIEADWFGKQDAKRGLGSGLTEIKAGIRLRYEIRREFAPYLGVEWAGKFGATKDFARGSGQATSEARFIAGLRFWF